MIKGYVYLLMTNSENGEVFKIGITKNNPLERIKQLSTGNDKKITLINSYQSQNYLKIERFLHRKYLTKTEAGNEWRNLSIEQTISFLDDCIEADNNIKFLLKNNPFYD